MKTLSLFRHAKSDWKDSAVIDDFSRPLAERGLMAAPQMGRVMRQNGVVPDLVLCSPATRTRQTLTLVKETAWDKPPHSIFDDRLYHADPATILAVVQAYAGDTPHVMVIGHNPGLQDLASRLSTDAGVSAPAFDHHFPTAALASFAFDVDNWAEISHQKGRLVLFKTPRGRKAA